MGYDRRLHEGHLLAGGKGTRLRPLTLHTPKPIVPIFNRPFLHYQIDLLKQVPEIDEVILSLNYQPRRIEDVFGDGSEPASRSATSSSPRRSAPAARCAMPATRCTDSVVVFNGDVLTQVDLAAVLRAAPRAPGEGDDRADAGRQPDRVRARRDRRRRQYPPLPREAEAGRDHLRHINAGIYVLEPDTFDRIPKDTPWSIERSFFPSFIERGETFVAYTYSGYWIDIGTPEKYMQVHRDIMDGRYKAPPFARGRRPGLVAPDVRVEDGATIEGPGVPRRGHGREGRRPRSARIRVLGRQLPRRGRRRRPRRHRLGERPHRAGSVVEDAIAGRHCHVGRAAAVGAGAVLGDKSVVTDWSRTRGMTRGLPAAAGRRVLDHVRPDS